MRMNHWNVRIIFLLLSKGCCSVWLIAENMIFFFGWITSHALYFFCYSFFVIVARLLIFWIYVEELVEMSLVMNDESIWCIMYNVGGNEYGQCGEEPERKDDTGRPLRRDIVIPQRCASNLVVRQVIFFTTNHYRVLELSYVEKIHFNISPP